MDVYLLFLVLYINAHFQCWTLVNRESPIEQLKRFSACLPRNIFLSVGRSSEINTSKRLEQSNKFGGKPGLYNKCRLVSLCEWKTVYWYFIPPSCFPRLRILLESSREANLILRLIKASKTTWRYKYQPAAALSDLHGDPSCCWAHLF